MNKLRPVSVSVLSLVFCLGGCTKRAEPEPSSKATAEKSASSDSTSSDKDEKAAKAKAMADKIKEHRKQMQAKKANKLAAKPVAKVTPTPGDPEKGEFTLEEATKGLGDKGALVAEIQTDLGNMTCELYEDRAPITVANFVGLARGVRPWKKGEKWVTSPLYDGTTFHRIIKGFMIQGGDPNKNGSGGPGYAIPDEIWENARHDTRGLLCMANRGPNTNGSQFFIMDGSAPHLDGGYTIFGMCKPESVIQKISAVNLRGPDKAKAPVIKTIKVKRDPSLARPAVADTKATDTAKTTEVANADKTKAAKPNATPPKAQDTPAAASGATKAKPAKAPSGTP